jgi:large subunit ribosomal protein L21
MKDSKMYAIIKTGAKQQKVSEGDVVLIEKLTGEQGSEIIFNEVLMVSQEDTVKIGKPFVNGAVVIGEVVAQTKGPKVTIGKMKKRKGYRKKTGHRQELTGMKIKKITI